MRRSILALAACMALGLAGPAGAAVVGGATLPDTMAVDGQSLQLNGAAVRTATVFRVKVYAAGLYLPQRSTDARAILASPGSKALVLHFLHSARKSDVEEHYREGEARNCGNGECGAADEAEFERLIAATPGAAVGDTLAYVVTRRGMRVLFNNRLLGEFSADLGGRIMAGFIGRVPPSEELKRGLLGVE